MMALVKPLIVCIWVELELVIGERTHCLLQFLSRKLVYPRASQVSFWGVAGHFLECYLGMVESTHG